MDELQERTQPGLRARDLRRRQKLKLEQVAAASGLSTGHLSRFERGEKFLSLSALIRLAHALDTSVGHLLGESGSTDDLHIMRAGSGQRRDVDDGAGPYDFLTLSGSVSANVGHETFIVSMSKSSKRANSGFHAGRELLYVLEGQLHVRIGNHELKLENGDYLEFPGHYQHEIESLTELSKFLVIVLESKP